MFMIDPLGASFNTTQSSLAVIGGDTSAYSNGTLDDLIDEFWPASSTVAKLAAPRASVAGYSSSLDAFQRSSYYRSNCGDHCVPSGGIPGVWLAEPSFQKYRKLPDV